MMPGDLLVHCTILECGRPMKKFGPIAHLNYIPQEGITWEETRIFLKTGNFVLKVETPGGLLTIPTIVDTANSFSGHPALMASLGEGFDANRIPEGCLAWLERVG